MPPSISIIVPVYRQERYLAETLRSIQHQTVQDWECIVVDDGSTDRTFEIAQEFAHTDERIRVIQQPNGGPSVARNFGYRESTPTTSYVTFMDGDDVWMPDALETLRNEAERHPEAIGAHAIAEFIDADGRMSDTPTFAKYGRKRTGFNGRAFVPWELDQPTCFETLCWSCPLYPPGLILTRRAAYEKIGLFDESMRLSEDWDILIRLTRIGALRFVDKVILGYRRHGGNTGHDLPINIAAVRRVYYKTFFSDENTPEQQALLRKGWRVLQGDRIAEKLGRARNKLLKGDPRRALRLAGESIGHAWRYARGYPSSNGI